MYSMKFEAFFGFDVKYFTESCRLKEKETCGLMTCGGQWAGPLDLYGKE